MCQRHLPSEPEPPNTTIKRYLDAWKCNARINHWYSDSGINVAHFEAPPKKLIVKEFGYDVMEVHFFVYNSVFGI